MKKQSDAPPRALQTIKDTAYELGVSTRHVYRLIQERKLESVRLGPTAVRVTTASVQRYIQSLQEVL